MHIFQVSAEGPEPFLPSSSESIRQNSISSLLRKRCCLPDIMFSFHALSRAILISTGAGAFSDGKFTMCQCPQTDEPHFYVTNITSDLSARKLCVNALCRAILISTLPSQNRLFKPLCGLVFACNFQSCLIINYNKVQKWAEGKLFF